MTNPFPEIQSYIDKGLTHSIHTSERRAFRACRRRWDWAYRHNYHPNVPIPPLEFGIAFHKAMEKFYEPRTWLSDVDVKGNIALVAFKKECEEQMRTYKRNNPDPDVEVLDDYQARIELGLGMLRYYCWEVSPVYDRNWTPIRVEIPFEVPIKHNNKQLLCKCDKCWKKWSSSEHGKLDIEAKIEYSLKDGRPLIESYRQNFWKGLPVIYGGRLDMLAQDQHGRYWIVDWKRLSLDSNILTPFGWKKIKDLTVGDYVIGADGNPTKILGEKVWEPDTVYELKMRDGTTVRCSADHLWKVHNNHSGKSEVVTTEQIMNKPSYVGYSIDPIGGPVEYIPLNAELPIHPYVLGSLIGDGCFTGSVLTFASKSGETVDLLRKYVDDDTDIIDQRFHGANKWQINGPLRNKLRVLGLWGKRAGEKLIPRDYLYASIEDRILLLQGLCDTDGNTGMFRWTTTSEQLCKDFCELVLSLGGTANVSVAKENLHQNGTTINVDQYLVNYTFSTNIEPNQLERKRIGRRIPTRKTRRIIQSVTRTNKKESMKCIYVDSPEHLFVTENFVLTHNTTKAILDEDIWNSSCWFCIR
jgi:hypothetical protein